MRHTGVVVRDLDAALAFYEKRLGFGVALRADERGAYIDNMLGLKDIRVTTVKLQAPGGGMLELLSFNHPRAQARKSCEANHTGITHFALTVDNLQRLFERLSADGIRFNAPPQLSPDGKALVTFCRDPEGNLIELVQVIER